MCIDSRNISQTIWFRKTLPSSYYIAPTFQQRHIKKSVLRHYDPAKLCITLRWKELDPPTIQMWLRLVEDINRMEYMVLTAQKQTWTLQHGSPGICSYITLKAGPSLDDLPQEVTIPLCLASLLLYYPPTHSTSLYLYSSFLRKFLCIKNMRKGCILHAYMHIFVKMQIFLLNFFTDLYTALVYVPVCIGQLKTMGCI